MEADLLNRVVSTYNFQQARFIRWFRQQLLWILSFAPILVIGESRETLAWIPLAAACMILTGCFLTRRTLTDNVLNLLLIGAASCLIASAAVAMHLELSVGGWFLSLAIAALLVLHKGAPWMRVTGIMIPLALWITGPVLHSFQPVDVALHLSSPAWLTIVSTTGNFAFAASVIHGFMVLSHDSRVQVVQILEHQVHSQNTVAGLLKQRTIDLELAQKLGKIGSWSYDFASGKIAWSEQMYDIFPQNMEDGEPTYEQHRSTIHPDDVAHWETTVQSCSKSGNHYTMRFRTFRTSTDGSKEDVWVEARGKGNLVDGKVIGLFGTCQDITEVVRNETRMSESQSRLFKAKALLSAALDHMPGPVYAKDRNGVFIFANKVFYDVVPCNGSVIGKSNFEVFPVHIAEHLHENDQKIFSSKKTVHFEEVVPGPDGRDRHYDTFKFPLLDEVGEPFAVTGISIDITERKEVQRKLEEQSKVSMHQAKLASIGQLAAGVGHEINNPLMIATATMDRIVKLLSASGFRSDELTKHIERHRTATGRITKIVQGLRTYARADNLEFCDFDLAENIEQTIGLVAEIYASDGVTLEFKRPSEVCTMRGNSGRIQQAVMNLLGNARDAVDTTQTKRIVVELQRLPSEFSLTVTDSGIGIPKVHQERLFTPFFTTKDVGKGTGIGLSVIASVVKEHGGQVSFKSSDQGTSFQILMPAGHVSAAA